MIKTYRDLLIHLQKLSQEQLDMNVSLADMNNEEIHPVKAFILSNDEGVEWVSDILDENHPILVFNNDN